MEIEFDPDKDEANIQTHGISLARAADFKMITVERVMRNGERRLHAVGTIDEGHYSLAFVFRRNAVRAISLRPAHEKEIEKMTRKNKGLSEEGATFVRDGITFDEDNPEWTEERFARAIPVEDLPADELAIILAAFPKTRAYVRGKQKAPTKIPVSLRLSSDVLAQFKAEGRGWQTRIDDALREFLKKAG